MRPSKDGCAIVFNDSLKRKSTKQLDAPCDFLDFWRMRAPTSQSRRKFLSLGIFTAIASGGAFGQIEPRRRYRAAIIGATGKGNYGHDHDLIFLDRPEVDTVAVADSDRAGGEKAAARAKARRLYADYQEMLSEEKPNLVSVAMRWTDQHHEIGKAVLESGAHLYIEKPFTQTLAQADELVAIAKRKNLKIAVAHQMRIAPQILGLKSAIDAGLIGDLVEIRAHGKQDSRAGGEDMIVLGTHLFDLMRFYAGEPVWCSARILAEGKEVAPPEIKRATEGIGPIIGDRIYATIAFPREVTASFVSDHRNQEAAGPWGIELIGTKRSIRILADIYPRIFVGEHTKFSDAGAHLNWEPWAGNSQANATASERTVPAANNRVADDWLKAIAEDREPVCSGMNGMKAVEIAHGIFAAGLSRQRVEFPLKNRKHPLLGG